MGRRRKGTPKDSLFVIAIFVLAFVIFLVNKIVSWLSTLSLVSWYFIVLAIVGILVIKRHLNKQKRLKIAEQRRLALERQGNLNHLKGMPPFEFEHFVCELFKQFGYDAHVTKSTGDGGKDIMIYKNKCLTVAECKRYSKNKITRPDIQKFHSAIIDCKAESGYFITTSDFTDQAISYVLDKPIKLINGIQLIRLIEESTKKEVPQKQLDRVIETISMADYL